MRFFCATIAFFVVSASGIGWAQIATSWTGPATGDWDVSTNWSSPGYPDNIAPTFYYDVTVGNNAHVRVSSDLPGNDGRIIIDRLNIDNGSTVELDETGLNWLRVIRSEDAGRELSGEIVNHGTIEVEGTGLGFDGPISLSGNGVIRLTRNTAIVGGITASNGTPTLTNVSNTVEGFGTIGNFASFVNESSGIFQANVGGETLVVDARNVDDGFINNGLMRAMNGGTLRLQGQGGGSQRLFNNTLGVITAENGSFVDLADSDVTGGVIKSVGTGQVLVDGGNRPRLRSLTLEGDVRFRDSAWVQAGGTINNRGTITIESSSSTMDFDGPVILEGGGTVRLAAAAARLGSGQVDLNNPVLTNVDNTIEGFGVVSNSTAYINEAGGVFQANVAGETLVIDPPNVDDGFVNQGLMQAVNGGTLQLRGQGGGTQRVFNNSLGIITADNGSFVDLTDSEVTGGLINSAGTGQIFANGSNRPKLRSLTLDGDVRFRDNAWVQGTGVLSNRGTITIEGATATLDFNGPVTLNGGGTVRLAATGAGFGTGQVDANNPVLSNVDNTIEGFGTLGSVTDYINGPSGTIQANVFGETLTIQGDLDNQGVLRATSGATLVYTRPKLDSSGTIETLGGADLNLTDLNNDGTLRTRDGGTALIDRLILSATSVVDIEILDGSPTAIVVDNGVATDDDAVLDGQIAVALKAGFTPDYNDPIVLIDSGERIGKFAEVDGVIVSSDLALAVTYNATQVLVEAALPGDANLDGTVDGVDFLAWNDNKFDTGTDWANGDFNGDGITDGQDFLLWNDNKFTTVDALTPVPEPSSWILAALMMPWILRRR